MWRLLLLALVPRLVRLGWQQLARRRRRRQQQAIPAGNAGWPLLVLLVVVLLLLVVVVLLLRLLVLLLVVMPLGLCRPWRTRGRRSWAASAKYTAWHMRLWRMCSCSRSVSGRAHKRERAARH